MHDVHQAIGVLGAALGLDNLEFDPNGNLTLAIGDDLAINLHQRDAKTIEIWTTILSKVDTSDASVLASLLVANHLGEGTGAARLALTPDRNGVILCERLQVEDLDDRALERRLANFIQHATFWSSQQALSEFAESRTRTAISDETPSFMIRA